MGNIGLLKRTVFFACLTVASKDTQDEEAKVYFKHTFDQLAAELRFRGFNNRDTYVQTLLPQSHMTFKELLGNILINPC